MKIALIGYGKMGREIEKIAISRGHQIVSVIDVNNLQDFDSENFKSADAAIEFTVPAVAFDNYLKCFAANVPVVTGTTGWLHRLDELKTLVAQNQTFFYASNFSVGVNVFDAVSRYIAKIMNQIPDYNVSMDEYHHIHKLDAPSGTAITIAEGILENIDRKTKWVNQETNETSQLGIKSYREGEIFGIHTVKYESEVDFITMTHHAKSRQGFALGAVLAAEFVHNKKGIYTMNDMLKL